MAFNLSADTEVFEVNRQTKLVSVVIFPILSILSLIGNVSTIFLTKKQTAFKASINLLIINIALANLINLLVSWIFVAESALNNWPFGRIACQTTRGLSMCCFAVVLVSHAGVSVERYIGVCRPFQARYKQIRIGFCILLLSWWLSIPLSLVYAILQPAYFYIPDEGYFCGETWATMIQAPYSAAVIYAEVCLAVLIFIPNCTVLCTYLKIIHSLKRQTLKRKQMSEMAIPNDMPIKKMKRTIHMLITSIILFNLTWLPFYVSCLFLDIRRSGGAVSLKVVSIVDILTYFLAFLYGCIQPFIYPIFNESYKKAYINALQKILDCCKRNNTEDTPASGGRRQDDKSNVVSQNDSCLNTFETKL